jgi:hypothetical protein
MLVWLSAAITLLLGVLYGGWWCVGLGGRVRGHLLVPRAGGAGLTLGCGPLRSLPGAGEAGGADGCGNAVVLPGDVHQRGGLVFSGDGDGGAGAQRQGGLAVLDGVVALWVAGVGGDAEGGVEPVEGVLGRGGEGLVGDAGAAGLGRVG